MDTEFLILKALCLQDDYTRRVYPFIKDEYFEDRNNRELFRIIGGYFGKFNRLPTKEALQIEGDALKIAEDDYKEILQNIDKIFASGTSNDIEWLVSKTEEFCKNAALYNALRKSMDIAAGNEKTLLRTSIPEIMNEALGVSFDTRIGHDYFRDAEKRYAGQHDQTARYPCDIDIINQITRGGFKKRTLNVWMAPSGVGKSIQLAHLAGSYMLSGEQVLFLTCELSEQEQGTRIDANRLNIDLDDLQGLSRDVYLAKIANLEKRTTGRLIIREYPEHTLNTSIVKTLFHELRQQEKFIPTVLVVDYLTICASSRLKQSSRSDPYLYYKSVAGEFRNLAIEYDIPVFSAIQTNRDGYGSTDITEKDTAESMGIFHIVDFLHAMIATDEMLSENRIMMKQLKNRYGPVNKPRFYNVGHNRNRMQMFDMEQASASLMESNSRVTAKPQFRTIQEKRGVA